MNANSKIMHTIMSIKHTIAHIQRNSQNILHNGQSASIMYLCIVSSGVPVPTLEHKQAVQEIIKARADLGRLGGLLKQAIAAGGDKVTLHRLLQNVDSGMRDLKAAAMKVQ